MEILRFLVLSVRGKRYSMSVSISWILLYGLTEELLKGKDLMMTWSFLFLSDSSVKRIDFLM